MKKNIKYNDFTSYEKNKEKITSLFTVIDNKEIKMQVLLADIQKDLLQNNLENAELNLNKLNEMLKQAEFFFIRLEANYFNAVLSKKQNKIKEAEDIIDSAIEFSKMRKYKLFLVKATKFDIELKESLNIPTDLDKINLRRLEKDLQV